MNKLITVLLTSTITLLSALTLPQSLMAADPVSTPSLQFSRLAGLDRYQTAFAVADKLASTLQINYSWGQQFQAIVLASGNNWPDAVSGTSLARQNKAPILLLDSKVTSIGSQETFAYMNMHVATGAKIFILGGKGVISSDFTTHLVSMGYSASNIQQIGGANRDETSFLVAKAADSTEVAVVSDQNFYDSISANPLYTLHDGNPCSILLAPPSGTLPKTEKDYLNSCTSAITMGDLGATADMYTLYPVAKWVQGSSASSTEYVTNSQALGSGFTSAFVATGEDFPDALTGTVLANATGGQYGSPVILVKHNSIPSESLLALDSALSASNGNNISSLTILGGQSAVNDTVATGLFGIMSANPNYQISSFSFADQQSIICNISNTNNTITATVPSGVDITSLIPDITVPNNVTLSPPQGVATNFSNPVVYSLTDNNGNVTKYTVTLTQQPPVVVPTTPATPVAVPTIPVTPVAVPTNPITPVASTSTDSITAFSFSNNSDINPVIVESTHSIDALVMYGTDLTHLSPVIAISPGATISPDASQTQDFSTPVNYIVTGQDGSKKQYTVNIMTDLSTSQATEGILSFNIPSVSAIGVIDDIAHTITLTVPADTDVSYLTPTITVVPGSTISPASGVPYDFNLSVPQYTVTKADGSQEPFTVMVIGSKNPYSGGSSANQLISFEFAGVASVTTPSSQANTINISVPRGTDLTQLSPLISASDNTTIFPRLGTVANFSSPVIYTIIAQDGAPQSYTIKVTASL
jgi:hypothetical protein